MAATTKLNAPNGVTVSVASEKVEGLLRRGFTKVEAPKASTEKSASSKSKKS